MVYLFDYHKKDYYMKLLSLFFLIVSNTTCAFNAEQFWTQEYNKRHDYPHVASASGPGSDLVQTKVLIDTLPHLFRKFCISSVLDLPCGDFYWMKAVDKSALYKYIGADIIAPLIHENQCNYATEKVQFIHANGTSDELPKVDLIICRDCLVHLSNNDIIAMLTNFKKSGAKYLLVTTFPGRTNQSIPTGGWQPLNLQGAPFNFPNPLIIINEQCTEQDGIYADKSMGLWKLEDILVN